MSQFTFTIYDTQATAAVVAENAGPLITSVVLRTTLPGGCSELSFTIHTPIFTPPLYLGKFYEVRVRDDKGIFWMGRMEDFKAHAGPDGEYWNVSAYGYGVNLDDQLYTSQDVSNTQTSTIIANALTSLTQQIDVQTITASSYTLSAATAVNLKLTTAAVVAQWATSFGDSSDAEQIWYIYPQDDGDIEFTFKPRPTTADLSCRVMTFTTKEFGLVGRQLANRVVVQYNDGASVVTVNDTDLQGAGPAGWNFIRTHLLVMPEITQSADATQAGQVFLNKVKTTRMAATNLITTTNTIFLDTNNQQVNPWRVRSGQILQFTDIFPDTGGSGTLTYNNSCLIAGTEWNEDAQTLSLTPESYDLQAELEIARARSLLTGRHTVAGAL